ncbi:MAG: hypothetical protein KUG79_05335 [Pseudomonadales bacterium]|nr:hypothetical protein [Pseudomonadales bacterium]
MSTLWLSSLVALGLLVLVAIAYGAHRMEMAKIEKTRRAAIHRDRFRDLSFIVEVIPAKTVPGKLPALITRAMIVHLETALNLDAGNADLRHHLDSTRRLHDAVVRGEPLPTRAVGGSIGEQLKDVQRGIKLLKEFILQQHKGGFLNKLEATGYIKSLHNVNLTATVDGLVSQANHSQSEGNKSLALRYFQLALNEITKSKSSGDYAEQVKDLTEKIKTLRADQKAVESAASEVNLKLAGSLTRKKDDDESSFDMKQIN